MEDDSPKTNRERMACMEKQIGEIHSALLGTKYNPDSGIIPRLSKVETYVDSDKKNKWLLTGLIGLLGAGTAYAKEIFTWLTHRAN